MSARLVLLALLLPLSSWAAPTSFTNDEGWYFSLKGALNLATDEDVRGDTGFTAVSGNTDMDLGFGISASVGYEWDGLRFEGEYSYRHNDGNINSAGFTNGFDADISYHSLMFNLIYDIELTKSIYWYNGGGVGVSWVGFDTEGGDDVDPQFAFQLMTGIGFDLTKNVGLTVGYRLFSTRDSDFSVAGVQYDLDTPFVNLFEVGLLYHF